MRILVGSVVLDDTFQQSAFGLSSIVGRAVWFREFCVVNYVVLVMWVGHRAELGLEWVSWSRVKKIVNRNHVTFFLHLIGLKFFDVEYDWSKNVEINRFKFSNCAVCFCSKLCFLKMIRLTFWKKQRVVDFYVLILTTKWRLRKLKKNKLRWESRYVFCFLLWKVKVKWKENFLTKSGCLNCLFYI